jgi:hypothetical protein
MPNPAALPGAPMGKTPILKDSMGMPIALHDDQKTPEANE